MSNMSQKDLREKMIKNGVSFMDIESVYLSEDTQIGNGTLVEPFVIFGKNVKIGQNCHIKGFSHLEEADIASNSDIGPFARVRGHSQIGENVNIGNFVEINRSKIGNKTKAAHLSYIGDTTIGVDTNIGAGVITCNYDGYNKNKTTIGDHCFVGSRTTLIAPVIVEDSSFIAAGTVVTKTVEKDSMIIGRCDNKIIENGATKYRNMKSMIKKAS